MRSLAYAVALASLGIFAACSDSPECAPGTTLKDGQCVAPVVTCSAGLVVKNGVCQLPTTSETCTADCAGRTCGDDGCGGTCGTCKTGEFCGPAGTCIPPGTCIADCAGKECGDDGCGGVCGLCNDVAKPICANNKCVSECVPDCEGGKACGGDGCGGSCGTCEEGSTCDARQRCVPDAWTCDRSRYDDQRACDCGCGVGDKDCDEPLPLAGCQLHEFCDDGVCASGVPAKWTCAATDYGDGLACNCNCGALDPDCSASIMTLGCGPGETCRADGTCGACVPECDGKSCGPDGCGGTCGTCGDPARPSCLDGLCVNPCSPRPVRCASGSDCSVAGRCVPTTWTCAAYDYDDGLACECGCGAPDPDCADVRLTVNNCPTGGACGANGFCSITACQRDGQCTAGRWCLGDYRTATGFSGQCGVPDAQGAPPGAGCEVDEDCATLVCLGGLCRRHCAADGDCVSGQKCLGLPVYSTRGRLFQGMSGMCDRPAGTLAACARQSDCGARETCLPFVDPATAGPRFLCATPDAAAVQAGGSCAERPCATGLFCVGPQSSRVCAKACPGGVTDCPSGFRCADVTFHDNGTTSIADDPKVPVCQP